MNKRLALLLAAALLLCACAPGDAGGAREAKAFAAGEGCYDVMLVPANEGYAPSAQAVDEAIAALGGILRARGFERFALSPQGDGGGILLRLALLNGDVGETFDALAGAVDSAAITFREGEEAEGELGLPSGVTAERIILDNDAISGAEAEQNAYTGGGYEPVISIGLTGDGEERLREATARIAGEGGVISIWVGPDRIYSPRVNEALVSDTVWVQGGLGPREVAALADRINALPPYRLAIGDIADRSGNDVSALVAGQMAQYAGRPPVVNPEHIYHSTLTARQVRLLQQPVTLAVLKRVAGDIAKVYPLSDYENIAAAESANYGFLLLYYAPGPAGDGEREIAKVIAYEGDKPYVLLGKYDTRAENQSVELG